MGGSKNIFFLGMFVSAVILLLLWILLFYSSTTVLKEKGECVFDVCVGDREGIIEESFFQLALITKPHLVDQQNLGPSLRILSANKFEMRHALIEGNYAIMKTRTITVKDVFFEIEDSVVVQIVVEIRGRNYLSI